MAKLPQGADAGPVPPVTMPAVSPEILAMLPRTRGASPGEDVTPGVSSGRDRNPYPVQEPNSPFALVFHPDRWDVIEGRVVPILSRLQFTPGSNGVDRGADGLPVPTLAIAQVEERGGRVIPFAATQDGKSYLRRVQVGTATVKKTGQVVPVWHHHTRWDSIFPGSTASTCDTVGYATWVRWLVESGALPAPLPWVLEVLASRITGRLAMCRAKVPDDKHPLVPRYEVDLAAVRSEQARLGLGAPAPAETADPVLS